MCFFLLLLLLKQPKVDGENLMGQLTFTTPVSTIMNTTVTTLRQYSRSTLLSFRPNPRSVVRLNNEVLCTLRSSGLLLYRHRGNRASSHKVGTWDYNQEPGIPCDSVGQIKTTKPCTKFDHIDTHLHIASFIAQSLGPNEKQTALSEFILDHQIGIMFVQQT